MTFLLRTQAAACMGFARRSGLTVAGHQKRKMTSGVPDAFLRSWYNVFAQKNSMYMGFIVGGVFATEFVFGTFTDAIWDSRNYSKTYETIDWSVFADDDDEEDEDDDDDGEDDDDDDDDDDE
uniref:Cytochrome b-c1 complex subunit 9 n=1 Tax=Corethron hystrix TaxID=216773 RepID=A0A7S1G1G4_9STRA|mmetsp:Transcript_9651/g.21450  ORF Transcript_9651/g.21450 Transcript_9651/m.21450 type:complete len:122 (+) Transcript_9651:147-512(+)